MKKVSVVVILTVLMLGRCAMQQERENLKNCEFNIDSAEVVSMSFPQVELKLNMSVENPNPDRVVIDKLDFTAFVSDKKLADGKTGLTTIIPPGETKIVPLTVKGSILEIGTGLLSSVQAGKAAYRVEGTAYVETWLGTIPVPFSVEPEEEE